MSEAHPGEEAAPQGIAVIWSLEARADVRAIDRDSAMQVLYCIGRYLSNRAGDVKKLRPPFIGFRLRCGDYRVFFAIRRTRTPSRLPESATAKTPTGEDYAEFTCFGHSAPLNQTNRRS